MIDKDLPCLIALPKINDERGNLSFLESNKHIPFEIKRVFWLYDVPVDSVRGGHAYLQQKEVIIALSGSFNVVITHRDGATKSYTLNNPYVGLYLPAYTWRHMDDFSTNSLALHISSSIFNPSDYIRDFNLYQKFLQSEYPDQRL